MVAVLVIDMDAVMMLRDGALAGSIVSFEVDLAEGVSDSTALFEWGHSIVSMVGLNGTPRSVSVRNLILILW